MGNERTPFGPAMLKRYMSCATNLAHAGGTPATDGRRPGHILRSPFPSFPPIEQSRCSIPPFERCKATPRSLLEHLVDRSTTLLSSLSHGFGLIFCALLCSAVRLVVP
ncbi:hypothetical protein FJTKL_07958 [Diaporthe vaccinii]|uniref:Uncharacterized protein n=1 Tax=Diaporthe vaccinii TaxID=105482 RepID=A0ABR4FEJ3_9PEZI